MPRSLITFVLLPGFPESYKFEKTYGMKKPLWFLAVFISQTLIAQDVGIGTSNPQSTLDVKGNQRIGGTSSYMKFDSLSGKIDWTNCNLFVPVSQFLMKHSAAGDGLYYNNSGGINGQLEYRNEFGNPVFYTNFLNGKGYFKGRLGIATINPLAGLHVADSSVLFSASGDMPGTAGPAPQQGTGRRMMWYPDKAAFRVGYASGDEWDENNIGNYSFAAGHSTLALESYSTALGSGTIAGGIVSTAIGNASAASGDYSTAIGTNAIASGNFSQAMGYNTIASGAASTTMGGATEAQGDYSIAMGRFTKAIGLRSTAMGDSTIASGDHSTGMGYHTIAGGNSSTALGSSTTASGFASTTMGQVTVASGNWSVAAGYNTVAKAINSVSIGIANDDTDSPHPIFPYPDDRLFQIGNGDYFTRSNAFTVLRNGNTGIGLASPAFPLSFAPLLGDKISLWSNSSNSYGFGIQSGLLQMHTDVSYSDIAFGFGSSVAFTERARIINAGGTGLDLSGRIVMRNGTSPLDINYGAGVWLYKADNSGLLGFMGTQNNQNIGFYGGPVGWGLAYDAINSRVGIGTATPAFILDVTSNASKTGNFVNTSTSYSSTGVYGSCNSSPGNGNGVLGEGGRVGVYGVANVSGGGNRYGIYGEAIGGTTAYGIYGYAGSSGTNWAGYFAGDVYALTYTTSDRKLKSDITPLTGALSIIHQLNPTFYTFKTSEFQQMQLPEGIHYGLIADEVRQVIPGIVKRAVHPATYENHDEVNGKKLSNEVEFNTVNYTEVIPILIGAVQEQQAMIEELRLKNQIIDQQQLQINALSQEIQLIKEKMK